MYTAIIVDDEEKSVSLVKNLLAKNCPQIEIVGLTTDPLEAFGLINRNHPDILFLDIDMPGTDGISIASSFEEHSFAIIYITAYDQFAMKAIKTNAVDYLLKPLAEKELILAVNKAIKRVQENKLLRNKVKEDAPLNSSNKLNKIALPSNDGLILLEISDIIRCQSDGCYTYFYTVQGEKIIVSYNIGEYEKQLKMFSFLRVHHQHLINLRHVKKYIKGRGGFALMSDGESIMVASRKKEEFINALTLSADA